VTLQEPREERVAGLVIALTTAERAARIFQGGKISPSEWLLTTVEALAVMECSGDFDGDAVCPECECFRDLSGRHDETCIVGIAAEAWRRFTQKGEHDAT